jgi:recombination protein RecR
MLPRALTDLINSLGQLPGVGSRTAERYAYYLFKSNSSIAKNLSKSLEQLHDNVKSCPITFAIIDADQEMSELYSDPARDKSQILVVEEPLDIYAIERTKSYHGTYHVLGGVISPMDNISIDELHVKELMERIKKDSVEEIIIATNPSVEGESTAILLEQLLHEKYPNLQITRLARGLPLGTSLEYADQITLTSALEGRTKL